MAAVTAYCSSAYWKKFDFAILFGDDAPSGHHQIASSFPVALLHCLLRQNAF